jgi:hypothetical protein
MEEIDELLEDLKKPGPQDGEDVPRIHNASIAALVAELYAGQYRKDAAASFETDFFVLPRNFRCLHKDKLPEFMAKFMEEMNWTRFKDMTPMSRLTLWHGVRSVYGFSENDFPYPKKLKDLDLSRNLSMEKFHLVKPEWVMGGIVAGALLAIAFSVVCARHSGNRSPEALRLQSLPQRNIPSTPNPFLPTPSWTGPGSPGHP